MCCTLIYVSKNNLPFLKYYISLNLKKHADTPLTKYETRKLWVPLQTNIPGEAKAIMLLQSVKSCLKYHLLFKKIDERWCDFLCYML